MAANPFALAPADLGLQAGMRVAYLPNPGNLGDAVIAFGALTWFTRHGISPVQWNRATAADAIVAAGGGNLIDRYDNLRHLLPLAAQRFPDAPVVILPSTVCGEKTLAALRSLPNLRTIACREQESHARVCAAGLPASLHHDLAFQVDLDPWREANARNGKLVAWRTDSERTTAAPPPGDHHEDLSERENRGWTLEICPAAAWKFIDSINRFAEVATNRLHVAIVSALLGIPTELYPGNYYKNAAVFGHSLAELASVTFAERERGE